MRKFCILIGLILFGLIGRSDYYNPFIGDDATPVLYWMSSDNVKVDEMPIATFIAPYFYEDEIDGNGYDAGIRVKVTGGDLTSPVFLSIYAGNGQSWDGTDGMPFMEDTGGYWGAGVPTGIQSSLLDGLTREMLDEYVFQMELGKYDESQDWAFVALAASDTKTFQELDQAGYIYRTHDLSPPTTGIWNPNFFTHPVIPEPSSSLLLLVGASILTLKRKRIK